MDDHQRKLWKEMIRIIENCLLNNTKDFYDVVGKLEGALDASEIKDPVLINQWYDLWTPLEIRRALEGNNITREKAENELKAMRKFLEENLKGERYG